MSYDDSITNPKNSGSTGTSTWANNMQDAVGAGGGGSIIAALEKSYVVYLDNGMYYARNGKTGKISTSHALYSTVMQTCIDALTALTGGIVFDKAGSHSTTTTINVKANVGVEGEGAGTVINKTAAGGTYEAIFNMVGSNSFLRNLKLNDTIQTAGTKLLISYPAAAIENIHVENVLITNSKHQGLVFSAADNTKTISNVTLRNVNVDTTETGAGIILGIGVQDALIDRCKVKDSFHTGIDIWATLQKITVQNCYVNKGAGHTNGMGIAISSIPDALPAETTEEIIIKNNHIQGAIQYDGITVWQNAQNVIIDGNIISDCARDGIRITYYTYGATNYYGKNVTIGHNQILDVLGNGIGVFGDGVAATENTTSISNNRIRGVGIYGIDLFDMNHCLVIGNRIWLPARATPNSSGIYLGADYSSIIGNYIYGDADVDYSIEEGVAHDYNYVVGNGGNKSPLIVGPTTIIIDRATNTIGWGDAKIQRGAANRIEILATDGFKASAAAVTELWTNNSTYNVITSARKAQFNKYAMDDGTEVISSGRIITPAGYKSSDASTGISDTLTTATGVATFKDGLLTAYTGT